MGTKKRILYAITKSTWGGAQKYVYNLATGISKNKFETAVAAGGSGPLLDKLRNAGIRTVNIPALQRDVSFFKEIASFRHLFEIFRSEKPDVIHLNSSKTGAIGAAAAFLHKLASKNKPLIVFTAHGWGFKEDRTPAARLAIFLISWISSLFQDKIITVSSADFASALKFIPRRKLAFIPNGIGGIDFFPREKARSFFSEKIRGKTTPETTLIGTVAELTKNKGLVYLIEAAAQIKFPAPVSGFKIIIIGEGEDREKLQARINSLGLADTVFLAGFIPEAERLLKGLDLFVLPSVKEGLPFALMEAAAAGLPVVASAVGGVPDIIENGKTGLLLKPADVPSLASAVKELLSNENKRIKLGNALKQRTADAFQKEIMLRKTALFYELR